MCCSGLRLIQDRCSLRFSGVLVPDQRAGWSAHRPCAPSSTRLRFFHVLGLVLGRTSGSEGSRHPTDEPLNALRCMRLTASATCRESILSAASKAARCVHRQHALAQHLNFSDSASALSSSESVSQSTAAPSQPGEGRTTRGTSPRGRREWAWVWSSPPPNLHSRVARMLRRSTRPIRQPLKVLGAHLGLERLRGQCLERHTQRG